MTGADAQTAELNDVIVAVLGSLGEAPQPIAAFNAVDRAVDHVFGRQYVTILAFEGELQTCRVYSTVPDTYPVGARKAMPDTDQTRRLKQAIPFVANSLEEIASAYPDHETVKALGATNLVNLPIVFEGKVLGLLCIAGGGAPRPETFTAQAQPLARILGPVLASSASARTG